MENRIFELIDIIDNEIQDSNASMVQAVNIGKHIDELKAKLRLVKKLNDVSNRRELLIAFFKYFRDNGETNIGMSIEQFVDAFLAHNNR